MCAKVIFAANVYSNNAAEIAVITNILSNQHGVNK